MKMGQLLGKKADKTKTFLEERNWLTGQVLIAMPSMIDSRFEKTVILVCSHGPEGAMGIVVNRLFGDLDFGGLLNQFGLALPPDTPERLVYYGGPVEPVRGFVLHSSDYDSEATTRISPTLHLTATVEILRALAEGAGPERSLLVLGYAGWSAGQLEAEIQANGWLTAPADLTILFDATIESKWQLALSSIGVSPTMLSSDVGHA